MRITRELNKEFLIYSYTIYTTITSSILYIVYKSTILLLQDKHIATIPQISLFWSLLLCSRPITLHNVMHHVTAVTYFFIVQKIKEKEKLNQRK